MRYADDAAAACDRLRGQMHNSPRRQYFRITRAEAEALAALAKVNTAQKNKT
tara:strand:- start:18934 stop:19089 length:156 start_codon:yes stop_codon:yes gene_type:complete